MDELTQQSVLNKVSEDKFLLVLNLPPILKSINAKALRSNNTVDLNTIQFSVEGSIVPEISVPSITIPFSGQNLAVTSYSRDPLQKNRVNFTINNRYTNYWILWKWLNILNDAKQSIYNADNLPSNNLVEKLHDYQTDISIFGLDEYNTRVIEFVYHKAFITKLGGINYNYQQSNQVTSYFEYDYSQFYTKLIE